MSNELSKGSFQPYEWFQEVFISLDQVTNGGKRMWVYRKVTEQSFSSTRERFLVGFYSPDRKWHEDSHYEQKEEAAARVNYLNGGSSREE